MIKLKLSELPDEMEIALEESNRIYTVAELKAEIIELGESHHESNWYTVKEKRWRPDALSVIRNYIESESDDMYEDWDERANDCITDDVVSKIQSVLDEAFRGESVSTYWIHEKPIEIDIFPDKSIRS